MKKKIPITFPFIDDADVNAVNKAVRFGWGKRCYDEIFKLEDSFRNLFNFKYAFATSSCTGALHIGLKSIDLKKNDEVILPDCTWISCSNAIEYLGAKPIFADIKKDTWCIDPIDVEKKITKKTKAILCVHLYGNVCEMNKLLNFYGFNFMNVVGYGARSILNIQHTFLLYTLISYNFLYTLHYNLHKKLHHLVIF